jgi:hypothetical protein
MTRSKLLAALFGCVMLLTCAALASGQGKKVTIQDPGERVLTQGPAGEPLDNVIFAGSEMGLNFEGKVVKGIPYSGQAITETTQKLGDGNRIINQNTASVYRDSEGRTRREEAIAAIGPMANGTMPEAIFINDPVAGVSYMLEPNSRVAHKMMPMRFEFRGEAGANKIRENHKTLAVGSPETFTVQVEPSVEADVKPGLARKMEKRPATESLGKQNIEGVEAEGTRITMTIPAGEIGNERAIEIVSERWYSPELQTVIMTKHSDPRFGETVYRLTNISRGEPDKSLFQVPSDYVIKESPPPLPPMPLRVRRPEEQ